MDVFGEPVSEAKYLGVLHGGPCSCHVMALQLLRTSAPRVLVKDGMPGVLELADERAETTMNWYVHIFSADLKAY